MSPPRLLYLGHAFPPGIADQFPELQPAGHYIETNQMTSIRPWFDIRSVGIHDIPLDLEKLPRTQAMGLPNDLNLLDCAPTLYHQLRSLIQLRRAWHQWTHAGWIPDLIMVCNFRPTYNAFVRRLVRQSPHRQFVLYMADSTLLGRRLPALKRLRYRFKPLKWLDDDMADMYDACVSTSQDAKEKFADRGVPWLWLPNGVDRHRAKDPATGPTQGPIVFGFFGMLAEHTGVTQLLRVFSARPRKAQLRICGFGKARPALEAEFAGQPNISFHGPLTPDGCLDFGAGCDVLINARPIVAGNDNNFSSKVFEYALAGRPVLTSRLSGVGDVLGDAAFYFDARRYDDELDRALQTLADIPRAELRRRGQLLQTRVMAEFAWDQQGIKLAEFLYRTVLHRPVISSQTAP